ncbi:MAG: DUF814 domain-containing protein [Planctomycetes bacterium]|nr:DUF814 domain-containing protein [Planctomycetota bacterium]
MDLRRRGRTLSRSAAARLSPARLEALVAACKPLFLGRAVRDVAGVPDHDLVLFFERQRGEDIPAALLLSLHPRYARILPVARRYRALEFRESSFVGVLRRALVGARLEHLEARRGDRAVDLRFAGCCGPEALVLDLHLELYGAHANAFLCSRPGTVRNLLHPDRRRGRALPPGTRYEPEASTAFDDPAAFDEPLSPALDIFAWAREALETPAEIERTELLRGRIARELGRRLQRAERRLAGLELQARAAERAGELAQRADLLKAGAHEISRGAREAFVTDWYGDPTQKVRIELDPRLGPHENAEQLYKKSRRLLDARAVAESERARGERERDALRSALAGLALLEDPGDVLERAEELRREGWLSAPPAPPRRRSEPTESLPYRRFQSFDGREIRVGRNARANDRLTFGLSRGNDLWLHAANSSGSHVVVPLGRAEEVPMETLHDAACLALHFSSSKALGGEVHVAPVKHLRRLRGGSPGQVSMQSPRTLHLRADPERLKRLLRGARDNEDEAAAVGDA